MSSQASIGIEYSETLLPRPGGDPLQLGPFSFSLDLCVSSSLKWNPPRTPGAGFAGGEITVALELKGTRKSGSLDVSSVLRVEAKWDGGKTSSSTSRSADRAGFRATDPRA